MPRPVYTGKKTSPVTDYSRKNAKKMSTKMRRKGAKAEIKEAVRESVQKTLFPLDRYYELKKARADVGLSPTEKVKARESRNYRIMNPKSPGAVAVGPKGESVPVGGVRGHPIGARPSASTRLLSERRAISRKPSGLSSLLVRPTTSEKEKEHEHKVTGALKEAKIRAAERKATEAIKQGKRRRGRPRKQVFAASESGMTPLDYYFSLIKNKR